MSGMGERRRTELHWAWRNVRARGRRAALTVALLAVALAANATVFSATDALVFHRVPYDDADRLVEIQRRDPKAGRAYDAFMSARLLDEWRRQTDLFAAVHGSLTKNLFLAGSAEPEVVPIADMTIGLVEMLGAKPRWGRSLVEGDDRQLDLQPVLLAESLARKRFGDPAAAVGQRLETTGEPLIVVGVMAEDFRFPDGVQRIWRALDPHGPLTRNFVGVSSIARLAPGVSIDLVKRMVEQRSADIGRASGVPFDYSAQPGPLRGGLVSSEQRRLFLVLLGAAACLLLIACANVVSLELAAAVHRARMYAIQLAVGASRAGLARTAMLEGACLVGAATAMALLLAQLGSTAIAAALPPRFAFRSANPIDLDGRAFMFMAAAAAVTWLLAALPVVLYASRGNLMDLLKLEGHAAAASGRSGLVRRALTIVEVALAVMLLVGSVVYVRSYLALIALEKGFDTTGVVTINLSIPPQAYRSVAEKRALAREAVERLRSRPGVLAAAEASPPPSIGANYQVLRLEIDNRAPIEEEISIAELDVVPDYFSVLRIPLRRGRLFDEFEPRTNVIIGEAFAERYWPGEDPVGRRFRRDPLGVWYHVVGVAGHVRTSQDPPGSRSTRAFQTYVPRQPPPPPKPAASPAPTRDTGGSFGSLNLMARVDSRQRAGDLYQTVRAIDARFILKLDFVDDVYARYFDDRLLATRVIAGFGILAFLIAAAGVYGVMAFLVADRTREIGIRMALGADRRRISRLVLGSSMRLVAIGAGLGVAGAIAASRWAQSQLFGVSATDPATLALVTLGVMATALLATWHPAHQAAQIDPKVLLKN
jgi:putative ABC transport system permease protein